MKSFQPFKADHFSLKSMMIENLLNVHNAQDDDEFKLLDSIKSTKFNAIIFDSLLMML